MPIDLSKVDPLTPKKELLEQAMRQSPGALSKLGKGKQGEEARIPADLKWLQEDKTALHDLVKQLDMTLGEVAREMRQAQTLMDNGRKQLDREQKLLYRQIKTLNGLLKKQIEAFELVNRQVKRIHLGETRVLPQIGIGLIGGLISAITVVVSLPWIELLIAQLK